MILGLCVSLLSILVAISFGINLFLLWHLRKVYRYLAEIAYIACENTGILALVTGAAKISSSEKSPKSDGTFFN